MRLASETLRIAGPGGEIAVHLSGRADGPVVLMAHSILSSSIMWQEQAALLAATGWRVVRADTRGHGSSTALADRCTMDDLVADSIAVLDYLQIDRAHYVGLSLGGMSGIGLGIRHPARLLSLCICDARADMPAAMAAPWDERIAMAQQQGCASLAVATTERWFGAAFLAANPDVGERFRNAASSTSSAGFVACARALQGLDYLGEAGRIATPTTLIVGANDGPLPQAMRGLQASIAGSVLELIADAGHLPNVDQPGAFNAALMRHFFNHRAWSQQ
jgi:3-oxoadipate enol-lactonase